MEIPVYMLKQTNYLVILFTIHTSIHDMFGMYVRYIRLARTFSSWMPGAADYRLLLLYIAGTSMVKLLSSIYTSLNFIEISIAKCI